MQFANFCPTVPWYWVITCISQWIYVTTRKHMAVQEPTGYHGLQVRCQQ